MSTLLGTPSKSASSGLRSILNSDVATPARGVAGWGRVQVLLGQSASVAHAFATFVPPAQVPNATENEQDPFGQFASE